MKNLIWTVCLCIGVLSCSKGGDSPEDEKLEVKPDAASLVFPLNNSECVDGTVISTVKSKVTFDWNTAKNTDEYELKLKNLQTNLTKGYIVANSEISITLDRGVAYSWYVVSLNKASGEKVQSSVWKFYNAGAGIVSYAPFPADHIAPLTGTEVAYTATGITLEWSGNDVDNDIEDYDIYFGETLSPELYQENITASSIENVIISQDTKYYWKIKTKDKRGNVSYSDVFQFIVN
tara:strand:+ start:2241 stop:2942 length:702 start_codon:yes stop_codon:yes gene_type:complete